MQLPCTAASSELTRTGILTTKLNVSGNGFSAIQGGRRLLHDVQSAVCTLHVLVIRGEADSAAWLML